MPPRKKSCTVCRRKRIKCDATFPECQMCIRFGRQCFGLDEGPMIVDMTETARHGMQSRRVKNHSMVPKLDVQRISSLAVITEAFYGRFLTYWTSEGDGKDIRNKLSWLHRLPSLSTDGTNNALVLALQATASAYCAVERQDMALTRYAWELYGQAVQKHGRFLARSEAGKDEVTIQMISTSVLFSFFETMQATSADAYRAHIYGAAKMFEVVDPRQCSEGVLCQIFYHLRTQMAFVQLTSNGRQTPVNVRRILHDALSYEELPIFQRLTTQVSSLADRYNDLQLETESDDPTRQGDLAEYMTTKANINDLWQEYNHTATSQLEILSWNDPETDIVRYRDAFTALTTAYFSAARILLALTAPHFAASFPDFVDHYRSILDAALFLETFRIGCAFMRMATPLYLVALHAPSMEQRSLAQGCFESWQTGSMRGISALALESIKRRQITGRAQTKFQGSEGVIFDEGVCMLMDSTLAGG